MISFIVPAHNEQACLGRTLEAIHDSARVLGQAYEIIVVDDASTDATVEIAQQSHARVVSVNHRQIAATRNAGGRAARGERLFFVDADTRINPRAVVSALREMDKGAVGGGGPVWLDEGKVPVYIRLLGYFSVILTKLAGFTGGAFMFCTREAFRATGGFNEKLFWAEEGAFALALKREGRFAVPWKPVLTSGRRFRTKSGLQMLAMVVRTVVFPRRMFTQRASVEKVWYDSNRTNDDKIPASLAFHLSNAVAFLLLVVLVTGPVWDFIPRSLTPLSSPLGKYRFVSGIFLCHVGMLAGPVAIVLLVNLLRQKRWTGVFQSVALIALCAWQAFLSTRGAIWIWTRLFHWFA